MRFVHLAALLLLTLPQFAQARSSSKFVPNTEAAFHKKAAAQRSAILKAGVSGERKFLMIFDSDMRMSSMIKLAPAVTLSTNATWVTSNSTVTLGADIENIDPAEIAAVEFLIDGAVFSTTSASQGYTASHVFCASITPGCFSAGLHDLTVRVTDVDGQQTLSAVVNLTIFSNGFEESCFEDTDGDRIANCDEVTEGSDYTDADTDDDGIPDGDELLGTVDGLDLPAMGLDMRRKDLLIEHDWTDDSEECSPHTHRPSPSVLQEITAMFAAAPIVNRDGSTGIHVIHDYGQGGVFSGGNYFSLPNGTVDYLLSPAYFTHRGNNFDSRRIGYFHYAMHIHRYESYPNSSGVAEVGGDDFIVSLICSGDNGSNNGTRNTIVHELGHNLGLHHGGDEECNSKPNYNSVMNYRFQFPGVDTTCDSFGDDVLQFSDGLRITLNELSINESAGVCGSQPVEFNGVPGYQSGLAIDLNPGYENTCGGALTTLEDSDDWATLTLSVLPNSLNKRRKAMTNAVCSDVPAL
jgi:hypothetical protein